MPANDLIMHTNGTTPVRVAIVGGGIAGLAAAGFLRKHPNYKVTVYELREEDWWESSAALGLQTNGSSIVEQLGITRKELQGVTGVGYRTYDLMDKQISKGRVVLRPDGETGFWFTHRQDLKDSLQQAATREGEGHPAQMAYNSRIKEIDAEAGILKFADGSTVEADLIIGADGIHSKVRESVIPASHPQPASTGLVVYRFLVEMDKIRATNNGKMPECLTFDDGAYVVIVCAGDDINRNTVIYPCRELGLMNFVCGVPDSSTLAQKHLKSPGTRDEIVEDMLKEFHDFPDWLNQLYKLSDLIELFPVIEQEPLPTYARGRTVLIGDAAHAMAPYQAQATNQTFEDVEALDVLLESASTRESIPDLLKSYDAVRRPHASKVQRDSLVSQNIISSPHCADAFLGFKPYVSMRQILARRAAKME